MNGTSAPKVIADLSAALRLTGEATIEVEAPDAGSMTDGFTLQAWVRPAKLDGNVVAFAGDGFVGNGVSFAAGRYDDLSTFRLGESGSIGSLYVPLNMRAFVFDATGCRGDARLIDYDARTLGAEWAGRVRSMLVVDLMSARQTSAVLFELAGLAGRGAAVEIGRVADLSSLAALGGSVGSVLLGFGLSLTVFDQPGCIGESRSFDADLADWSDRVRSLMVTRAVQPGPAGTMRPRRVGILSGPASTGLALDLVPPASSVLPATVHFAGAKLTTERWHHVALSVSDTGSVSYVNGRVVAVDAAPVDCAGGWTIGDRFPGEIGLISMHRVTLSADQIAAGRFDLPRRDDPTLAAAWMLERSGRQWLDEMVSGAKVPLPVGAAFWVDAVFPRSMLDSTLGQQAVSEASRRGNEAVHVARLNTQSALDKAHRKADERRRHANARAAAMAQAARIGRLQAIVGGVAETLGPDGAAIEPPSAADTTTLVDIALDLTGVTFLAGRQERRGSVPAAHTIRRIERDTKAGLATLIVGDLPRPICALASGPADRASATYVYWIEEPGTIRRCTDSGADVAVVLEGLIPGRGGEWDIAVDHARRWIFWSNGREIWRGGLNLFGGVYGARIFVSRGQSPSPIALAVDQSNGDLFWLDRELEVVRTVAVDGVRIRDLYEALDPRDALVLDPFDVSKLEMQLQDPTHPAVATQRLYWNAEHRQLVEVAVVDDPGLFCWLQGHDGTAGQYNRIEAMDDVHPSGVTWRPADAPRRLSAEGEWFAHVYRKGTGASATVHAVIAKRHIADAGANTNANANANYGYGYDGWAMGTGKRTPMFDWGAERGNPPSMFATNVSGSRLVAASMETAVVVMTSSGRITPLDGHHVAGARCQTVAITGDGALAIVGSSDRTLTVWDATTGVWLRSFDGHTTGISSAVTYPLGDGYRVLSGSYDGLITHWDPATGEPLGTLRGHTLMVRAVAITDDRTRVVAAADRNIKVWDLASGACLRTLIGHASAVFDVTLSADGLRVISASADATLKLWDLTTGECLRTFEGHAGMVRTALISADERRLISVGDDMAKSWDLDPRRHASTMRFDGRHDHVTLGPVFLDCTHGLGIELQIHPLELADGATVVSLGNGPDGANITLSYDARGCLTLRVEDYGKVVTVRSTDGRRLTATGWHTVSMSMDRSGVVSFCVDGIMVGSGLQAMAPRTGLRLRNELGRSNVGVGSPLRAEVGVVRLWNRSLTAAEVDRFHRHPLTAPHGPLRAYHRSVMEHRNGRPYLMSGTSDGATQAVALFELAVDKGLALHSRSGDAQARLLGAHHDRQLADERAAAMLQAARQTADADVAAAHSVNQADHAEAQQILSAAHATEAAQRAAAAADLAAANAAKQVKVAAAAQQARSQRSLAEQRAATITDAARRRADEIQRAANADLAAAAAEKAKYT